MSPPSRIVTDRLDAWLAAERGADRALVLAEVAVGLTSLAVAVAAAWRVFAAPPPVEALTHPTLLVAALGFAFAALAGRVIPAGQARAPSLRPALVDALAEALGKAPRGDLEAIVRDAVGPERVRAAIDRRLTGDALAEHIDAALGDADEAAGGAEADAAFDEVLAALDRPAERRRLAVWLTRLLAEQPELVDGIARPVTRRLLRDAWFERPFSWGTLDKKTRRFLGKDKGRAWAEDVVARVLADLARPPPRARDVHRSLVPTARRIASRHAAQRVAERLRRDEALDRLVADAAGEAAADIEPALLGALGHVVDERAATAAGAVDARRLRTLLARSADGTARALRVACFAGGAALGALAGLWSGA